MVYFILIFRTTLYSHVHYLWRFEDFFLNFLKPESEKRQ